LRKSNLTYTIPFIISIGLLSLILLGGSENALKLTKEDGIIESLSALFYLLSIIFCIVGIKKKNFLFFSWVWLLLSILFLGEETSWFQRYIGYSVTQVEKINSQAEFNIHNLYFLYGGEYIIHGNFHLRLKNLLTSQSLFRIGLILYFFILPLLSLTPLGNRLLKKINYPKPNLFFITTMWLSIIITVVPIFFTSSAIKPALAETRETVYAMFIFTYISSFTTKMNRSW